MKRAKALLPGLFISLSLFAVNDPEKRTNDSDSLVRYKSLREFVEKSHHEFHSRTFFMSTLNEGELKDDFALAQGTGIGMVTPPLRGFQFGFSGYFIFNLASSRIWIPDPLTNAPNRYEAGQFDVRNLRNRFDMDRLEELFVHYSFRGSSIRLGRMDLRTPFMNPQDGRMRPTLEEALWLRIASDRKLSFQGGFVHRVSPRSTLDWSLTGESVGIYASGLNPDGSKSGYPGNVHSRGFFMGNLTWKPLKNTSIDLWDGYFENVFNTAMVEIKNSIPLPNASTKLQQGLMVIYQNTIGQGGNSLPELAYAEKGGEATVVSGRLGVKTKRNLIQANYTRIGSNSRYLMPREWGRDPFYTFMNRERNEGFGDVHAAMISDTFTGKNEKWELTLAYGYYRLPEVTNFQLNKYGMPSYHQVNFLSSYSFGGFWKGMTLRTLIATKFRDNGMPTDAKYTYNKVNMVNFNLMVDFRI